MDLLLDIVDNFLEDVDAICNVSRTLSVLSSEDDIDKVSQTRTYIYNEYIYYKIFKRIGNVVF